MDGLIELPLQMLAVDVGRKVEQVVGEQQQRDEDQSLDEAALGCGLGPIAKLRREPGRDDGRENEKCLEFAGEMQGVAGMRVLDGALQLVGGQGIGLRRLRGQQQEQRGAKHPTPAIIARRSCEPK